MICKHCGQGLVNYHFFNPRNKFDKAFFAAGVPDGNTCFACAGDYQCIECKTVKPASEFRLQGRICHDCKNGAKETAQIAEIL